MKIQPCTWREAEAFAKCRLDRRRAYAIGPSQFNERRKVVLETLTYVSSCTGCCELGDYGSGSENYETHAVHGCLVGAGCHECGYHGVRRTGMWFDLEFNRL